MRKLKYIGYGGMGKQVRDLLHVRDLTELICKQIEMIDLFYGEVFNVGGGIFSNLSLLETTKLCAEITDNKIEPESSVEERPADLIWYVSDNKKAGTTFDWKPSRPPEIILRDTFEWLVQNEKIFSKIFKY